MTITTALSTIQFVLSPFPEPSEPIWDEICLEWQLFDADGFRCWGETPSACYNHFQGVLST